MKSTSLRRAAFAALFLAPVLTACGFNAQTDQVYQPAEGVLNRDGEVDILNALIVSGQDGSGTFVANLVNNDQSTADRLVDVSGPAVTVPPEVFADADDADVTIPADGALNLATEGIVIVTGDGVAAGSFVTLTLTFASGEATTVRVPVVRADGDYADVPLPAGTEPTEAPDEEESTEGTAH